ncbi:hypothetical protein [Gaiella sp.]|uniref:hypothetical protein n=1 Tax=Gaiella sp. TaxID=2663207 RepID=UPI002D07B619|nr:hypothetical protein [Gaiella sp.]HWO81403.1 hypothetical protein [Gaiella sp.]
MTRQRLARVFWLGAAAILVVAALISLVAILGGGFSETDGRILATLGSLLYTGAAALAGLALAEREKARPLGLALLGLSAVTFVLLAAAIWGADGDTAWRIALSGALYLVAGLVATTGLLLTTRPALQRLALVAGALTVVAVSLTLVPIWQDDLGSTLGKVMGVAWILAALAYFLGPVLQRWSAVGEAESGPRVLASLDGVELVATRLPVEDVLVTKRPRSGEQLVLRRRT